MNRKTGSALAAILALSVLTGCGAGQESPMVFMQRDNLGLLVSGSAVDAGATINVAYEGKNIAIIPVSYEESTGKRRRVTSESGNGQKDTLAVFGRFKADAEAGPETSAGLGKFFATGLSAVRISDGFKHHLSKKNKQGDDKKADGLGGGPK